MSNTSPHNRVQRGATPEPALAGTTVVRLMQARRITIRALAQRMNIAQKRVRQVRTHGVRGEAFVRDWLAAIQGGDARSRT